MDVSFEELCKLFLLQLTKGCKNANCVNMDCARNLSCSLPFELIYIGDDKKVIARRAVTMAKEGTALSCAAVNRLYSARSDEIKSLLPDAVFQPKECCVKVKKCDEKESMYA